MSSNFFAADGYGQYLGLLIISHLWHVSYHTRSECREKSINLSKARLKGLDVVTSFLLSPSHADIYCIIFSCHEFGQATVVKFSGSPNTCHSQM